VVNPAEGNQPHSCKVDNDTQPIPSIVNKESNQSVELVRAYWDANKDIAGKNLKCEEYQWNEDEQRYALTESYQRYHYPLPNEKPWIYAWTKSAQTTYPSGGTAEDETLLWTVVDGVLNDLLYFYNNSPSKYWVELISVNGGTNNATRWWTDWYWTDYNANSYYQCTNPETNRFVPTGTPGVSSNTPSGISTESRIFTTTAEERSSNLSGIYSADGTRATMTRGGEWDIQALAYKSIQCPGYFERYFDDPENFEPGEFYWKYDDPGDYSMMFLPPRADNPNTGFVAIYRPHFGARHAKASPWTINEDNSITHPFGFASQDWFVLATTPEGDDSLHYWGGYLRTCTMAKTILDTPYTTRAMTEEERSAFLIKTNVDTSHCTSAEDAYSLRISGHTSCVAESTTDSDDENSPDTGTDPATGTVAGDTDENTNVSDQTDSTASIENQNIEPTAGGELSLELLLFLWIIVFVDNFGVLSVTNTLLSIR